MEEVIDKLLNSEPWTAYRARLDILNQTEDEPEVREAKMRLLLHPLIVNIIEELQFWQDEVVSNHKKAGLWLHKLSFLAEAGLTFGDNYILREAAAEMVGNADENGVLPVKVNIPAVFGGSGQDTWGWSMCDAPLLLYCLVRMGYGENDKLRRGTEFLAQKARENGWPCASSPALGKFRGPGRKDDPCPYGTLLMLKLLCQYRDLKESELAKQGAEALLDLWERSLETSPYLFHMGTDFRKLKAPFVWYDILHAADVLTRFSRLKNDARLGQIVEIIKRKADENGMFTAESVWTAWKGFDFAQKKEPSSWITLLALRSIKRFES